MPEHQPVAINRALQKMYAAKPMAMFSARFLHHIDKAVYRFSSQRTTFLALITGLPVITLTTTVEIWPASHFAAPLYPRHPPDRYAGRYRFQLRTATFPGLVLQLES